MFFFYFNLVFSFYELLEKANGYAVASFVITEANTVVYTTTSVKDISLKNTALPEIMTNLAIYRENKKNLVYHDTKIGQENSFFFTTPARGKYYFIISASNFKKDAKLGVDYKIYLGEENRPNIISTNDVEISKTEGFVKRLLEYARNNLTIQEIEFEDDMKYKDAYDGIVRTAMYMIGIKIIATLGTIFYSSLKTREFFQRQNFK